MTTLLTETEAEAETEAETDNPTYTMRANMRSGNLSGFIKRERSTHLQCAWVVAQQAKNIV